MDSGKLIYHPSLKSNHTMSQLAVSNKDKASLLWATFFPELSMGGPRFPPPHPVSKFSYSLITDSKYTA